MDEFKKYLRDHRNLLDVESPPRSELWQQIHQQLPVHRKTVAIPMFRWVAAACIVLLTGVATYMLVNIEPGTEQVKLQPEPATNGQIPEITGRTDSSVPAISPLPGEVIAENAEAKNTKSLNAQAKPRKTIRPALSKKLSPVDMLQENYATIINMQLKKLESTPIHVENPHYFHAFKKQWYDMEKDEKKIKDDIALYGLNDAVLMQFIQLYQQKLLLLKQLQDEINKMNNRAHQYPEMQSKSPSFLKM